MIKIVHIITGLNTGGAEMMLYKLISGANRQKFSYSVISLLDEGSIGKTIKEIGIPVYVINMKRTIPTPAACIRLAKVVRFLKPDIIQGWMYHGNLAAQLASMLYMGKAFVLWNIRGTHTDLKVEPPLTAFTIWLGARLSSLPRRIINNSLCSALSHQKFLGYQADRWEIIPNGFDTNAFIPSREARIRLRVELELPVNAILIGHVGRYHPVKDHATLLRAAASLHQSHDEVYFVLVGEGVESSNTELKILIDTLSLHGCVRMLGKRNDMPYLTAAFDIATLSSLTEGFPNVIGEAMSCGVPCVVTDVGDSAWIVGDTGRAVPPGDPAALAQAWHVLIEAGQDKRRALGDVARQRVIDNFSLDSVVKHYEQLYEDVCTSKTRG